MNSLNEELRRVNDIKGLKVLGDMKQQPQSDAKVSLDLRVPTFKHISSQVRSEILEKLHHVNVCQINNNNNKNLKVTLKALMFCSGSD